MEKKEVFGSENDLSLKFKRWVEKKIAKSYNGYDPNETDILIDEILNNFSNMLDNYNLVSLELQKLKNKNTSLIEENNILKNKVTQLSNEIELERRKKK